jgi:hypothetical protein
MQAAMNAIKVSAASAVRADGKGSGTFPGVLPGTYSLMISAVFSKQALTWGQAIQMHAGSNSNPRLAECDAGELTDQ